MRDKEEKEQEQQAKAEQENEAAASDTGVSAQPAAWARPGGHRGVHAECPPSSLEPETPAKPETA